MNIGIALRILLSAGLVWGVGASSVARAEGSPAFVSTVVRSCARWLATRIASYESPAVRAADRAGESAFEKAHESFTALADGEEKFERALADGRLIGSRAYWDRARGHRGEVQQRKLYWMLRKLRMYCEHLKAVYREHSFGVSKTGWTLGGRDLDRIEDLVHGYCALTDYRYH